MVIIQRSEATKGHFIFHGEKINVEDICRIPRYVRVSFAAGGSVNSALMAIVAIFSRNSILASLTVRESAYKYVVVKLVLRITKL